MTKDRRLFTRATDIAKLKGLRRTAIAAMRARGFYTVDDLWRHLGVDFEDRLRDIAFGSGMDSEELWSVLVDDAVEQAKSRGVSGWARIVSANGLELVLAAILVVIVAVAAHQAVRVQISTVTTVTKSLPAYHLITEEDVEEISKPSLPGLVVSKKEALGRYTLRPVSLGSALNRTEISQMKLDPSVMNSRQILALTAWVGAIEPVSGGKISLLFSGIWAKETQATDIPASLIVQDVLLLASEPKGSEATIVVALKQADLKQLGPFLGGAKIHLLSPAD